MKKILIAAAIAVTAAYASMASEKKVNTIISAGLSESNSNFTIDYSGAPDSKSTSVNIFADCRVLFNQCNVALKAQTDFGVSWGDQEDLVFVKSDESDVQTGPKFDFYLGAGYNFVNTEHHLLGIYGLAGTEISGYTYKYSTSYAGRTSEDEYTTTFVQFMLGGDFDYTLFVSDNMGLDIGCRVTFPVAGEAKIEHKSTATGYPDVTVSSTKDIKAGGYNISPRLGLTVKF